VKHKAKLKIFKLLSISISFVIILSACNLPGRLGVPTDQNITGTNAVMTMQVKPTQTQMAVIMPTHVVSTVMVSPITTPIPPNIPVWSAYNYTCKFVSGGGNMTMNLAWIDRSTNEEGYIVYRDKLAIATLAPNSTFYVDVVFVPTGKTLEYSVEAFNKDWRASGSTITYGCR
jgi:hypothetical protein